uniref:Vesicle transport protein got1b n=2 Tax=Tetraselmis sp. GSL018 TaxID=582737 RepID=A0A061S822_9CHLO|mmetsp:Transcript_42511/g.100886  ORF Transcript_42511/g.100886 Transcript_42511/m.100886 type:complete len:139 (-) Transcript_42511:174-590(-)|eukprot:CAMPEP_0177620202 /NCGR_PEP_ID=MMETSP0419_2-20121207/26746_1 /TAXON_ID=582737 /ORGANISM="Tetraselmis sp., Strain GSL018" /LENGTH=138 /DNA_ID=CAMNT_0019119677 /DNA_START=620 /DNA_END=1036 /DNA_ORIENTATION=+
MDDRRKIGIGLTGFGVLFTLLGMMLLFDKGLIAMGNVLFLAGVALTIGPSATMRFFMRRKNHKGSVFFLGGMAVVIYGWPIIGMLVETYGFIVLFSGFFPTVLMFLKRIPFAGKILDAPVIKSAINRVAPASAEGLPM